MLFSGFQSSNQDELNPCIRCCCVCRARGILIYPVIPTFLALMDCVLPSSSGSNDSTIERELAYCFPHERTSIVLKNGPPLSLGSAFVIKADVDMDLRVALVFS